MAVPRSKGRGDLEKEEQEEQRTPNRTKIKSRATKARNGARRVDVWHAARQIRTRRSSRVTVPPCPLGRAVGHLGGVWEVSCVARHGPAMPMPILPYSTLQPARAAASRRRKLQPPQLPAAAVGKANT